MLSKVHSEAAVALIDAANSNDWNPALNLVERAFDARGAILMGYEGFGSHPVAVLAGSAGMRPDRQSDYLANFANLDVRAQFCGRQQSGKIIHDYQMGAIRDVDRLPIYAEFLLPLDLGRFVGVNLGLSATEGKSHTYFALAKANDSEPPTALESQQVLAMGEFARSAVCTASVINALRARAQHLRVAIEKLDIGMVFVGMNREIADCNAAARRMLDDRAAVRADNGRLSFLDPDSDAELAKALACDIALQPGGMWLARAKDEGALVVIAVNIDAADLELNKPVLTLLLVDPQRRARHGHGAWRRLFNLTRSECEVAELMLMGMTRGKIADERDVSGGTVHTQMRALYGKLRVSKLSEAVLLLSATMGD